MTNKINGIDVSECPCKDDDKCLEVPILNEYGDLIDYQDCEPQTLCPYRSKTKIQRLQEENKELKEMLSKELAKEVLYDLQIACFKNQIVDTIFHYPVPLTTLYDYLISRTGITQKEFDDLTEKAMQECGLLEDSEDDTTNNK